MKLTPLQQTEGITVLSLFDGMSCGQLALQRAGIKVKAYYAAEIDKHAIKVTQHNFPGTIQLGDVTQVTAATLPKIDMLIGGSPCQGFSFAGKKLNFKDPRSKLFFEYVRLLKECKPTWFLLENVRMEYAHELVISQYLGTSPVKINSSLFSAQSRLRLYWTNINQITYGLFNDRATYIPLPPDKGILLKHILQTDVPKKYFLSDKMIAWLLRHSDKNLAKGNGYNFTPITDLEIKSVSIVTREGSQIDNNFIAVGLVEKRTEEAKQIRKANNVKGIYTNPYRGKQLEPRSDGKTGAILTTLTNDNILCIGSMQKNATVLINKSTPMVSAAGEGGGHVPMITGNGINIRRLTPVECERLQTVPDNYTAPVSDTQRYRMLGNGWTVDVVAYIFSFILNPTKP